MVCGHAGKPKAEDSVPVTIVLKGPLRAFPQLLGTVRLGDVNPALIAVTEDTKLPGIAADLAVLNQPAANVRLEVDFDLLATVRPRHDELVGHTAIIRPSVPMNRVPGTSPAPVPQQVQNSCMLASTHVEARPRAMVGSADRGAPT